MIQTKSSILNRKDSEKEIQKTKKLEKKRKEKSRKSYMFLEIQSLKACRSNFYKNREGTFFSWFMLLKVYINIRCLEKSCLYFKLFCRRVKLGVGYIFSDITEKHQAGEGILNSSNAWHTEAVAQRCSIKEVFLKVSQNSLENTCARVSFL